MIHKLIKTAIVSLSLVAFTSTIYPCSTFSLSSFKNHCFGKSYDFPIGYGHISVNKRNLVKISISRNDEKKIAWVSKYGSITFNQFGKELPNGGMNEAGLVIEEMTLENTDYPAIDSRFGLEELQWIQYMLDNFSTVDEVLASDNSIRMSAYSAHPIHIMMSDKSGDVAVLEYVNNKTVIHRDRSLPFTALTNDTYDNSLDYMKHFRHVQSPRQLPKTMSSLDRFVRASYYTKNYCSQYNASDYSFMILSSVNQYNHTQWSIVYDIKNMRISYKTLNNDRIRSISLNNFDFSPMTPALYTDIDSDIQNGSIDFLPYSFAANKSLIDVVFSSLNGFINVSQEDLNQLTQYPETTVPLPMVGK